jgi:hypothetical protein
VAAQALAVTLQGEGGARGRGRLWLLWGAGRRGGCGKVLSETAAHLDRDCS